MLAKPSGWIVLLLCVLFGCVSSENGLVSPNREKVVFDPALLGDWVFVDFSGASQGDSSMRIERLDDKALGEFYVVTWSSSGQVTPPPGFQRFQGNLVVIGDSRYFDFTSMDKKDGDRHGFFKVNQEKAGLALQFMNPSYISSHPTVLAHRFDESGRGLFSISPPVLTAKTAELCRFLEEHQRDPELWGDELALKFQRR